MATVPSFSTFSLPKSILSTINELGYEGPTPVQEQSIPILLNQKDLLAQAQTGTGKTAAFALPILANIKLASKNPQALVVVPTRELSIQVAEAFQSYAKNLKGFHVCPIYGGQDYKTQLKALNRGAHVVVATPGRAMDHMRRGCLNLNDLEIVVLDEADEMLNRGFLEDVTWILEKAPAKVQTALFSATMPDSIQKISKRYLNKPEHVLIKAESGSVELIDQAYVLVEKGRKLDILTRFLEVEDIEAAIIFSRTKVMSSELAEKLKARGYAAEALNGDMNQGQRQKVIERFKSGHLDIVVATDVAARGIDVERVSHVINYDIPHDTESYVHRIGRTGRAGRKGRAILFVAPRERHLLRDIERAIKKRIAEISPPSLEDRDKKRAEQLVVKVQEIIEDPRRLKHHLALVENVRAQLDCDPLELAAVFSCLMHKSSAPTKASNEREEKDVNRKPRGKSNDNFKAKKKSFKNKEFKNKDKRRVRPKG